jgi:hypothetical protein
LDDYGNYMTYGEATNACEMREMRYLPEGLVEGCRLKRNIGRDQAITFDDVELPTDRVADRLYAEQRAAFAVEADPGAVADVAAQPAETRWRAARHLVGAGALLWQWAEAFAGAM